MLGLATPASAQRVINPAQTSEIVRLFGWMDPGQELVVETSNLSPGADTVLHLWDAAPAASALLESDDTNEQAAEGGDEPDEYAGCLMDAPHLQPPEVVPREAPDRNFHAREPEELPERFEGLRGAREPRAARFAVSQEVLQLQEEYLARSANLNHEEAAELKAAMFGD
jgi:hypothetical protein